MSEKSEPSVLGALPHSRPHRRSDKRAARPAEPLSTQSATAPVGAIDPDESSSQGDSSSQDASSSREDSSTGATELLRTGVQALAELAEIGLTAGARALRAAVSRLPHP
ncbi:MAG TPA: hypothetical protein VHV75_08580 [Solirubrobacteraceae bacterium]|nr:hypothetical protein [Solirubrobacteraceae bacterium]